MNIKLDCVLLIDDDDDDNYFHQIVLKESFSVNNIKIAENGFEALEYLQSEEIKPDLIFLDINMPKMTGWEFVEEYKKIKKDRKPVIIMLTTSLNPIDKKRAAHVQEISGYETKPLTTETMNNILSKFFPEK